MGKQMWLFRQVLACNIGCRLYQGISQRFLTIQVQDLLLGQVEGPELSWEAGTRDLLPWVLRREEEHGHGAWGHVDLGWRADAPAAPALTPRSAPASPWEISGGQLKDA